MKQSEFFSPAPPDYKWPQVPEAEIFIQDRIEEYLSRNSLANHLAQQMARETNTEFLAWLDHLILSKRGTSETELAKIGYVCMPKVSTPRGSSAFWHPLADLPVILVSTIESTISCAISVDSISDFQLVHHLSHPIIGLPFSKYREARIPGERGNLTLVERRGTRGFLPDMTQRAPKYFLWLERWTNRPRNYSSPQEGMRDTLKMAKAMVKEVGSGLGASIFLEGERRYWQQRNRAGQLQKARQDKLGLGWANHDHHTFRSSRPAFPQLMQILLTFGFKKRERFYAGAESGWGAQVMEQPEARLIIFADVDLTPEEISVDFTVKALPVLPKPGTIGLWCALHGESMLEAGMHHLEAKFNFDGLRNGLQKSGVGFMKPFSDFPHLRQAFSEGEMWPVPQKKLDLLLSRNQISRESYEKFLQQGAVGSHLENLQRRNGFKGFNQRGVSDIIRDVNPELQARNKSGGGAA